MFRFIVIASFLFLIPSFAMETMPDILLFVGNPGSGKSTIINALIQKIVVKSGFSIGSGLTKDFSKNEHSHDGKQYLLIDTPGLDDIKTMEKAAIQIENALKLGGNYKIFFVITVDQGRFKVGDLLTIQRILGAIDIQEIQYNVIVNKVHPNTKANLIERDVRAILKKVSHKAQSIFFINWDDRLDDQDNVFFEPSPDFKKFIYQESKSIFIKESQVARIYTGKMEDLMKSGQSKNEPVATVAFIYPRETENLEPPQEEPIESNNDLADANDVSHHREKSKNRRQCLVQ
jgi:GTPase Era involved in 16S rRNA processing